jgi:hypothetical protein
MSDDEDPFERLDADAADREGDPFERLSDTGPEDDKQESADDTQADGAEPEDDWVDEYGLEDGPRGSRGPERETTDDGTTALDDDRDRDGMNLDVGRRPDVEADPLGDTEQRDGDPFEENDSLFERRDTEGIDPDVVWQDLASADARSAEGNHDRTFADVSKHAYCEQCEHFSPPPDVACAHEGTDIVEFLDMETVRVVDCPIVAEREKLQNE